MAPTLFSPTSAGVHGNGWTAPCRNAVGAYHGHLGFSNNAIPGLSVPSQVSVAPMVFKGRAQPFSTSALLRQVATQPAAATSIPPVSFRSHPLRYLCVFPTLHTTIAWGLLGPTYFFLAATGLTPLFLAGPQGVAVLKTRIPDFVPNGFVYGLRDCRASVAARGTQEPTIEEWMETSIRKAAKGTWFGAKKLRSFITRVRGLNTPEGMTSEVERWAKVLEKKGLPDAEDAREPTEPSKSNPLRRYITDQASGVKVRNLADAVAAWVLVKVSCSVRSRARRNLKTSLTSFHTNSGAKCLLPVRIPLSLWLTPKVVRMTLRRAA